MNNDKKKSESGPHTAQLFHHCADLCPAGLYRHILARPSRAGCSHAVVPVTNVDNLHRLPDRRHRTGHIGLAVYAIIEPDRVRRLLDRQTSPIWQQCPDNVPGLSQAF